MNRAFVIALTGGIGSGKSTAAQFFQSKGIAVFDTDQIARDVVEPNSSGLKQIIEKFGAQILNSDGSLNRKALGRLVFADEVLRTWLEALLHPMIRERQQQKIAEATSAYVVLEIPLLVDKAKNPAIDKVLLIHCSPSIQTERAMKRDNLTKEHVENIIASQPSQEQRQAFADMVVENNTDQATFLATLEPLHEQFLLQASAAR